LNASANGATFRCMTDKASKITKCPKCDVEVRDIGRGWQIDPAGRCVELEGTKWGNAGEYEWCPALAAAMPDDVSWPGFNQKAKVLAEIERVRKPEKKEDDGPND
jgi:hypothetical protein